jgi:tripartite-type tricarboxylate transporter receptor subunit TctC
MTTTTRAISSLTTALAAATLSFSAFGQAYPAKTITLTMPIGPVTAYYIILRQMADQIQAKTGRTIVFDVVLGAGGTLAPAKVKRADPDGYTIGLGYQGAMTIDPYISKDQRYDSLKDFAYISMLTRHGLAFVAGAKVPANNLQELIALAKAKPGQVKLGQGSTGSLIGLLRIQEAAGVQFMEVPYKSSNDFDAALLSGDVDVVLTTAGTALPQIKAGRTKALFIGSRARSPLLPNTQSVSEVYPDIEVISWYGLFAPAGTPQDRIDWLHREWTAQLRDPKIADRMQNTFGYEIVASTGQEFFDQIKREVPINTAVARRYNIGQ